MDDESLPKNLQIFKAELQSLLLQTQINMRKLTMNDVQLSDLMKSSVGEIKEEAESNIEELNKIIKNCETMQDEFLQIEALQKKMQGMIFRIVCEDIVRKKEKELEELRGK